MSPAEGTPGIEDEVDALIDGRPGPELMVPAYDDEAVPVADGIFRSGGTTAAYLVTTPRARVVVNTGMGFEAPHHRRLFDAVHPGPTPYIVTTQGHVDHVGGVARFRQPGTVYVAQADNQRCQRDDARIAALRMATAGIWFHLGPDIRRIAAENTGPPATQDRPVPDLTFDRHLALEVDGLELELHATPGGETTDSCVVWLPQHRTCLVSNCFGPLFPHFPNLNTLRGDRYRFVEPYLDAVATVRALRPEVLVTGRHLPITGAALIDASLGRLAGAVEYVHAETLAGMNAGEGLAGLMARIELPPHLRVGQGYGKVPWAVRTIWESYTGWFQRRSTTELYPDDGGTAAELAALAGPDAVVMRAGALLAAGRPVAAIGLAEAALAADPGHRGALSVMADAHLAQLAAGGEANFWESGWLRHQAAAWRRRLEEAEGRP